MIDSYKLIKSRRKTFGISVKLDGTVVIRAPLKAPDILVRQFVAKYKSWIESKLVKINELKTNKPNSNSFYFQGIVYPIIVNNEWEVPYFDGQSLILNQNHLNVVDIVLKGWYTAKAMELVLPIITKYGKTFNLKYSGPKITSAKTRWGSCSHRGAICFSYKIAMLPDYVVRYIVVHELAHLKHFNHSDNFWHEVGLMYPEYKLAIKWLKDNRYILANQAV